jgi:hypothetical protein
VKTKHIKNQKEDLIMKKFIALIVVVAVIMSLGLSVFAADRLRTRDQLQDQTCLSTSASTMRQNRAGDRLQDGSCLILRTRQHDRLRDRTCI